MCQQAEMDRAMAATTEGEHALAGGDLPRAERAFTAALDGLDATMPADRPAAEVVAAAELGLGRIHLRRHDFRAADLRFDRVQRLIPASPAGFYWGGCVAAHHTNFPRADWLLTAALDRDVRMGKAYLQRAFVRVKQRRVDLALADLHEAARYRPADDDTRLLTAALLLCAQDWHRAASVVADVDSTRPEAAAIVGIARHIANLHAAARALASRDRRAARTHLLAVGDERTWRCIAALDQFDGQHAEAARGWARVLADTPSDPLARLGLALCSGSPARTELRDIAADTAAPERVRRAAGQASAALYIRDGEWSAALDVLHTLPDVPWRPTVYAEALYRTDRHDELRRLPRNPWQDVALARSRSTDAANDITGDERARRELALVLRDAGLATALRGDWSTAAALLRRADRAMPGEPDPLDALIRGLGGHRSAAIELLDVAATRAPTDHRITHTQALLLLHALGSGTTSAVGNVSWHRCVGAWTAVSHSEDFWEQWARRAQDRYGRAVPATVIQSVRTTVREFVEHRLPSDGLRTLLRREYDAARMLELLGGLPVGEPQAPRLVCGPLRIAAVGVQRQLSEFLLRPPDDRVDVVAVITRFSVLGLAETQLAAGRPREAARIALDLRCPSCRRTTGDLHLVTIAEPLLCEPDCPEFDRRNPAFAAIPEKHDVLSRASARLAATTLLGIARSDITRNDMDLADARTCWRTAITLANGFGGRADILRVAVDDALGRAKALAGKHDGTDAIAVLDAVLTVIPAPDATERDRVTHILARWLNFRGVQAFNADGPTVGARADLTRAVALGPHLPLPRLNLGMVLYAAAHDALAASDIPQGVQLLRAAITEFEHGLANRPDDPEFTRQLEQARSRLGVVLDRYAGRRSPGEGQV